MSDTEPPYIEVGVSAQWTVDVPDGVEREDLFTADELRESVIDSLGLERDEIPEESLVLMVNCDVTWDTSVEAER